ncbi:MAG: YfhO family protein, partial [Vicingaceae bacterium]
MAWSYGQAETFNLLIPGLYAPGASLGKDSETYSELAKKGVPKNQIKDYLKGIPMYYGTQSTPTGPSYMGAGLIFLFLLMLFLYKGNFKWILLGTIGTSIVFSWGSDFLLVNEFFFNHFPLFNKFRTPSMWLFLTMISITFGAMMALKIIIEKQYDSEKLKKALFISGGILGGISVITYLMGGSLLDFDGPYDAQLAQNGFPIDSVIQDRINLVKSDALRTLVIIASLFGIVWAILKNKIKNLTLGLTLISLIVIGDMWFVGKRFLNEDDFKKAKSFEKSILATAADQQVLNDPEVNYRTFNASVNSFNELTPSYFHQHVGGYSAVKLSRYQDLIEKHLSKSNMNVFNMLNAKYFITGQTGQEVAQQNPDANGSVWFVNNIDWAKNADEEMEKLTDFNPQSTVIIDSRFKDYIGDLKPTSSPQNSIQLSKFHPDNMEYTSNSASENFAVFSEIWYKGNEDWKAYIDGEETEFIRVNYLLRGMKIPAGKHKIEFKFYPKSHYIGTKISLASSVLIILMLLGLFVMMAMGKE